MRSTTWHLKKGDDHRPFFLSLVGLILSFATMNVVAKDWGVYAEVDSLTYSEAMSIKGFIDHFSGTLQSGSKALTHDRVESGVRYQQWWLGKVIRYDFTLAFSPDTALLNYQIENNIAIDTTRAYEIDLKAKHLRSTGISFGRFFQPKDNLRYGIGMQWLSSEQFYDGYIQASVDPGTVTSADLSAFETLLANLDVSDVSNASEILALGESLQPAVDALRQQIESTHISGAADYYYYKPALREDEFEAFNEVDFSAPSGQGYSFDFFVEWQILPQWQASMRVRDLYSAIRWKNAPSTQVSADVTQAALDAVAVLDQWLAEDIIKRASGQFFQPLNPSDPDNPLAAIPAIQQQILSDRYTAQVRNQDFTQHLPKQILLTTDYQVTTFMKASVGWLETEVGGFPHLRTHFFQHYWLHYEMQAKAYGIGFDSRYFKLGLITDSGDFDKAQYLALNVTANIMF